MADETKRREHNQPKEIRIPISKSFIVLLLISIAVSFFLGYSYFNITHSVQTGNQQQTGNTGNQAGQTTASPQPSTIAQFALPNYETPQGSSSANVNLIEFGDYQCPYCSDFFTKTGPQIQQNYISNGKVKFYFFDFAFLGPDSTTLAEGAWCANDQGLFWQYHDYIYANQKQENSGWANVTQVEALAKNIQGLDASKFNTCLASGTYASRVSQNTALGQQNGIQGTPGFLVGNDKIGYTLIAGDYPYSSFQQTLDAALQKA